MIRRRVALAVIHGIGAQRRDWAEGFVRRVRRTVEARFPGVDVYPDVIWWAPVTQRYEDTLIGRYRDGLSWQWLRRLLSRTVVWLAEAAWRSPAGYFIADRVRLMHL